MSKIRETAQAFPKIFWYILAALIDSLALFLFLRINPDSNHSGFVYSQGIAVTDGLIPNKDFFSPYGFVGPFVNGLWLELVNNSLLSLLLLYGIITIFSGLIIQKEVSRLIDPFIGFFSNLVFVMTLASTIPWPSILATCFTLLGLLVLNSKRKYLLEKSHEKYFFIFPVVLLFYLALFTRIHLLATPILLTVYFYVIRKYLNQKFLHAWVLCNLFCGIFFVSIMSSLGMTKEFFHQVIVWPFTSFKSPDLNLSFFTSFIWFPFSFFILFMLVWSLKLLAKRISNPITRGLEFIGLIGLFFLILTINKHDFKDAKIDTLKTIPGLIWNFSAYFEFAPLLCSAFLSFLGIFYSILNQIKHKFQINLSLKSLENGFMGIMVIVGWIQLYPLHDNVHLWFVSPLFIIPAFYYLRMMVVDFAKYSEAIIKILACFLVVQFYSLSTFLSIPRESLSSQSLRGMYSSVQVKNTLDTTLKLLDLNISDRNLRNNCESSLTSVSNGRYRSIDGNFALNSFGNFVTVIPRVAVVEKVPRFVFDCNASVETNRKMSEKGFRIVFEVPNVFLSKDISPTNSVLYEKY